MEVANSISQVFLYLCFSVLAGSFILQLVPNKYRPDVSVSNRILLISTGLVPILSFIPILDIILYIAPRLGLVDSVKVVLTTYTVGTAWNFTLFGSAILLLLIAVAKPSEKGLIAFLGLTLTVGLILTVAWSSHAGSVDPILGIASDFMHLAAVSIWVGILLVVGWCSLNHKNWLEFLSWFSIVAMSCLATTAISGVLLMDLMVEDYLDSWMVSYGQGVFIKHLFLLPLVFYALVNGLIVKFLISKNASFNPIPWIRLEGFILIVIFMITAIFSQQAPPHGNYLTSDAVSPLFRLFHDDIIDVGNTIGFGGGPVTVLFFFVSIVLMGLNIWSIFKKTSIMISFLLSCLFVMSVYIMFMISVVVR